MEENEKYDISGADSGSVTNINNMNNMNGMNNINGMNNMNGTNNTNYYNASNMPRPSYEEIMKDADEKIKKDDETNAGYIKKNGVAALLFAIVMTFALYKNHGTIMSIFATAMLDGFFLYSVKRSEKRMDVTSIIYAVAIILFGISDFLTANSVTIFFNNIAIVVLYVTMMFHVFCNDREWTFIKYVHSVLCVVFGTIGDLHTFFGDFGSYRRCTRAKKNPKLIYIVTGLLVAFPLLFIVVGLLASSDVVFGTLVYDIINIDFITEHLFGIVFMFFFYLLLSYTSFRYVAAGKIKSESSNHKIAEPVFAITVLSPITFVYIIYSGIQFYYLFLGGKLPNGYSYAKYAREGFFQLLVVCIINVLIVFIVQALFRDNLVCKILMTVISICTYVMVASSGYRMILYIRSYNLTELRVFVLWALFVIAILLVGIIIQIFNERFPLFKYTLAVITICYMAISFARVDYQIARYNLSNSAYECDYVDYSYLSRLSEDAAPALALCDDRHIERYFNRIDDREMTLRSFNYSVYKAKSLRR